MCGFNAPYSPNNAPTMIIVDAYHSAVMSSLFAHRLSSVRPMRASFGCAHTADLA